MAGDPTRQPSVDKVQCRAMGATISRPNSQLSACMLTTCKILPSWLAVLHPVVQLFILKHLDKEVNNQDQTNISKQNEKDLNCLWKPMSVPPILLFLCQELRLCVTLFSTSDIVVSTWKSNKCMQIPKNVSWPICSNRVVSTKAME